MTKEEVRNIATEVMLEHDDLIKRLLARVPTSNVKQACDLLQCSRKWLYENVDILKGRRKNNRGDWEFETLELIKFRSSRLSSGVPRP